MINRVGERYRDYDADAKDYRDDDFGHCDWCGLECLKSELTPTGEAPDLVMVCPLPHTTVPDAGHPPD